MVIDICKSITYSTLLAKLSGKGPGKLCIILLDMSYKIQEYPDAYQKLCGRVEDQPE